MNLCCKADTRNRHDIQTGNTKLPAGMTGLLMLPPLPVGRFFVLTAGSCGYEGSSLIVFCPFGTGIQEARKRLAKLAI